MAAKKALKQSQENPAFHGRFFKGDTPKTSLSKLQNKALEHYLPIDHCWLVVWTPLKNISQLGWLFPIYGKIKNVPNHQPDCQFTFWTVDVLESQRPAAKVLQTLELRGGRSNGSHTLPGAKSRLGRNHALDLWNWGILVVTSGSPWWGSKGISLQRLQNGWGSHDYDIIMTLEQ